MPAIVVTVNTISPQLDKRHQELQVIDRALHLAAQAARSAGGAVTSGNIVDVGGVTLGTWTYTPAASS
jgi:hypothetical protein